MPHRGAAMRVLFRIKLVFGAVQPILGKVSWACACSASFVSLTAPETRDSVERCRSTAGPRNLTAVAKTAHDSVMSRQTTTRQCRCRRRCPPTGRPSKPPQSGSLPRDLWTPLQYNQSMRSSPKGKCSTAPMRALGALGFGWIRSALHGLWLSTPSAESLHRAGPDWAPATSAASSRPRLAARSRCNPNSRAMVIRASSPLSPCRRICSASEASSCRQISSTPRNAVSAVGQAQWAGPLGLPA